MWSIGSCRPLLQMDPPACQSRIELQRHLWQQCLRLADEPIGNAIAEVQAQHNEIEANAKAPKVAIPMQNLPQVGHHAGLVK